MTPATSLSPMSLDRWRESARSPLRVLDQLQHHIMQQEPDIQALVPEPGRFDRLRRELETCGNGELRGVPVGIKDIIHVAGLETRAGSTLPPAALIGPEADCVRALKGAGAVILGKTVSTEFAYFAPGPTRNPHNPHHTPGGSSSGSAAAVAAGYCPVALGTQTIGSICRPAAFCGVVGYKPSFGRIPTQGVIPLAPSLDHIGIFATRVADAHLVGKTLCERWNPVEMDRQPRLGIPEGPYLERASGEGLRHFRRLCDQLRAAGWPLLSAEIFEDFDQIESLHHRIVAAEAARVHRDWFAEFGELYRPKTRELLERGRSISDEELAASLPEIERLRARIEAQMGDMAIDFWISPAATGPAPAGLEATGDPVMNLPWTQAGLPAISLPAGSAEVGLPLGLQIIGRFQDDEALLATSVHLERALEQLQ